MKGPNFLSNLEMGWSFSRRIAKSLEKRLIFLLLKKDSKEKEWTVESLFYELLIAYVALFCFIVFFLIAGQNLGLWVLV